MNSNMINDMTFVEISRMENVKYFHIPSSTPKKVKMNVDELIAIIEKSELARTIENQVDDEVKGMLVLGDPEDYSTADAYCMVDEETLYEPKTGEVKSEIDERIVHTEPCCASLVSVMRYIGLESVAYNNQPEWQPFTRQHRVLPDVGLFLYKGEVVEFEFPNIGFEWMTDQFDRSLAVQSQFSGLVSLNSPAHILYSVKELKKGVEFITFRIRNSQINKVFLWHNEDIIEIESSFLFSGRKYNNILYVYNTESVNLREVRCKMSLVYVPPLYCTLTTLKLDDNDGFVANIDGCEYVIPRRKCITLKRVGDTMMTRDGEIFKVDMVAQSVGTYELDEVCRYVNDTMRQPDTSAAVKIMKKNVVDMRAFIKRFKLPEGRHNNFPYHIKVEMASNNLEIVAADRENNFVYIDNQHGGANKRSRVAAFVRQQKMFYMDSQQSMAKRIGENFFMIGNNKFNLKILIKPVLMIYKMEIDNEVWIIFQFMHNDPLISGPKTYRTRTIHYRRQIARMMCIENRKEDAFCYIGEAFSEVKAYIKKSITDHLEKLEI